MDLISCNFSTIISTVGAIGVAWIGLIQYRDKKSAAVRDEENKKAETFRNEGALIQMEMSQASLNLAIITGKIVTGQAANVEMQPAMDWADAIMIKYCDFLRRFATQTM